MITGTFDVELNDFFGGTSSLTGEWRATVETSDNSITCVVIEPEPAGQTTGKSRVEELAKEPGRHRRKRSL